MTFCVFLVEMIGTKAQTTMNTVVATALRCEASNRPIIEGETAYFVSHHSDARQILVGEKDLDIYIDPYYRSKRELPLEDDLTGLNFHHIELDGEGNPVKGEFAFSIGYSALRKYPGIFSKFFKWDW